MNKIDLIKEAVNTIRENKGLDAYSDFNDETHLRNDLALDSLDLAELTVRIEKDTGVDVFADGVVQTIGEVLKRIS